jgi:hypothetical protein
MKITKAAFKAAGDAIDAGLKAVDGLVFRYQEPDEFATLQASKKDNKTTLRHVYDVDDLRNVFATTICNPPAKVDKMGHSHPMAAANRNYALDFAQRLAMRAGLTVYDWQSSGASIAHDVKGIRVNYFAKDLKLEPKADKVSVDSLVTIVDTDYYLDMNKHLARVVRPTLLYTMVPEAVAGQDSDSSFFFDADNTVTNIVNGGSSYNHQLWNYSHDCITVQAAVRCLRLPFIGNVLLKGKEVVVYLVERKNIGKNRQLIFLIPMNAESISLFRARTLFRLRHQNLERLTTNITIKANEDHTASEWNILEIKKDDGLWVSFAPVGSSAACTMPKALYDAMLVRVKHAGKVLPSLGDYKSSLAVYYPGKDQASMVGIMAATAHAFFSLKVAPRKDRLAAVLPVSYDVAEDPESGDSFKPTMVAFMKPLVTSSYAFVDNIHSDERAVKGRIEDVKSKVLEINPFEGQCMRDFTYELVNEAEAGLMVPLPSEEVAARQNRPAQMTIYYRANNALVDAPARIDSHLKKSAENGKISDPRLISQEPADSKIEYSACMYQVTDHILSRLPCITVGVTPKAIAERVASICQASDYVVAGDFSRMDGRVSNIFRVLEEMYTLRLFNRAYRRRIRELMKRTIGARARTPHGVKYNMGYSQASGRTDTIIYNSVRSAYVLYKARRLMIIDGQHPTHREAWDWLVANTAITGDDTLAGELDPTCFSKSADAVGQVLTSDVYQRDAPGVNFLARIYSPTVWHGTEDSMSDIRRQLSKIHLSVGNILDKKGKLVAKGESYVLTDANTPVLGSFSKKIVELNLGRGVRADVASSTWWSRYSADVQYPNENGNDWMSEQFDIDFPRFDKDFYTTWLASCDKLEHLLEAPGFETEVKPQLKTEDRSVQVNNEILETKGITADVDNSVAVPLVADPEVPPVRPAPAEEFKNKKQRRAEAKAAKATANKTGQPPAAEAGTQLNKKSETAAPDGEKQDEGPDKGSEKSKPKTGGGASSGTRTTGSEEKKGQGKAERSKSRRTGPTIRELDSRSV